MANGQEAPTVLMFDGGDPLWLQMAQEGATEAGWQSLPFDNPHDALEAFTQTVSALVTGLGSADPLSGRHPARHLIHRSDELNVPRALLSGHPYAGRYIRQRTSDIVIRKSEGLQIPEQVSAWLGKLSQI